MNFISIQERELLNIRRPLLPRQQPQSLERVEEERLLAREEWALDVGELKEHVRDLDAS